MAKVVDKGTHFEIKKGFMESLTEGLQVLVPALLDKRKKDEKKKEEVRKARLALEKQKAEFVGLDPALQDAIKGVAPDLVAELFSDAGIKELEHSDESLFTKFRHRKVHAGLEKPQKPAVPSTRKETPQEAAERTKKAFEAIKAEAEASVAVRRDEFISRLDPEKATSQMITMGIPLTQEGVLAYMTQGQGNLAQAAVAIPGTPEYNKKHTDEMVKGLQGEFPDVHPGVLRTWAESQVTGAPLPTGFKMPKSKSGQNLDLERSSQSIRARQLNIDQARLQLDVTGKFADLTGFFITNGIDQTTAMAAAKGLLTEGTLPQGFAWPADKKKELDLKVQEMQLAQGNQQLAEARLKSPELEKLLDLASKASTAGDDQKALEYLAQADKVFRKVFGYPEDKKTGFLMGVFGNSILGPAGALDAVPGIPNGAGARVFLTQKSAQHFLASMLEDPKGLAASLAKGAWETKWMITGRGPSAELSPQVKEQTEAFGETLLQKIQDPNTPEDARQQIASLAAKLKAAIEAKNTPEILRLMREMK